VADVETQIVDPALYNVAKAAELSGLSVWQIRGLIARRQIPIVRVGRKFYLRKQTLLKFLENAEGKR
jgi:excisionase family DNA binding protein